MAKWVYCFGDGKAEGRAEMRNLLGGKGANLAEMSSLGLPVPPGFTITTELCTHYYANKETYPAELNDEVEAGIASIEKVVGAGFGGKRFIQMCTSGRRENSSASRRYGCIASRS